MVKQARVVRVGAYGVVERGGNVLLVRASPRSDVPGTWWLPGGGVEFGEQPAAAVVREVQEETGLRVRVTGPPTVVSDVLEVRDRGIVLHSVRLCYPVAVEGGEERAESDGTSDAIAWLPRPMVASVATLPFVQHVLGLAPADPDAVLVVEDGVVRRRTDDPQM